MQDNREGEGMRISTKKDDPGYKEDAYLYKVTLDGKERLDCFTADEEAGMIFCYDEKITPTGKKLRKIDPVTGDPVIIIHTGKVVIVKPESLTDPEGSFNSAHPRYVGHTPRKRK